MKILILGSEGFIGSHCVSHFTKIGYAVYGIDLFEQASAPYQYSKVSRLSPELDELFVKENFDAIINAAGSGNVSYSMAHPIQDFEANCLDTIRTLDAIRKHQPECKYLHLSSAAVYGNPVKLPMKETDALQPVSSYGWHKMIAENLCREYSSLFGLHTAIVRPFSVYGPGLKKQMFWDLYQKIKTKAPLELYGTGMESRDYIHINDAVVAFQCIIEKAPMKADCYNLASGIESTVADAVQFYFGALGFTEPYRFGGQVRTGDPVNWRADITKISGLGFISKINLKEGLVDVAKWIKDF